MSTDAQGQHRRSRVVVETAYILPYKSAMKTIGINSTMMPSTVQITQEQLIELVKGLLRGVVVDEAWYRMNYQDVDAAIRAGAYKSAKQHFVENGYFEGRRPGRVV